MTLDFLLWTRLRWVLKSVCREAWEMGEERIVLICGTSDQHHSAISSFPHRERFLNSYLWTCCEHRQTGKIKGQVTEDLLVHSAYVFMHVCTHRQGFSLSSTLPYVMCLWPTILKKSVVCYQKSVQYAWICHRIIFPQLLGDVQLFLGKLPRQRDLS